MRVLIFPSREAAVARAARAIIDTLAAKPDAVLGLATGGTMEPVYARLVEAHRAGRISFARARTFNLDEYVGLAPDHPRSYHRYMAKQLFDHVDLASGSTALPRGDAADPATEAQRYEAAIRAAGGIDLQLLGIGRNGHIGFNEPTSALSSRTRIKTLTRSTREANARYFPSLDATPRFAITTGIGTVLDSRAVLLLALGTEKAEAVQAMIEGPLAAFCPGSALQLHSDATVVVDQDAALALRLCAYYDDIHPDGADAPL
jgi:glucosamine-6-phosphate deaminase